MSRATDSELVEAWRETLREFEASGLSQRAFCEAEDLSLSTFGYWRRKLEGMREPEEVRFFPLDFLKGGQGGEGVNLVVELPGGVVMRFSGLAR